MYEVKAELNRAEFDELEMLIFETEGLEGWNLYENFENKGYRLQGVFETEGEAQAKSSELAKKVSLQNDILVSALKDSDWKDSYKEHFKPWSVGDLHWIPVWLKSEYDLPDAHEAVWLDPGMAFGTGNHGTTRLCVEQLIAFRDSGADMAKASIVEAGCGSGILAISAAKLGFRNVSGFDIDEDSVRIAEENAEENKTNEISFYVGDLDTGFREEGFDCVLANILAKTLLEFPQQLVDATAQGGWLVLSGILGTEAEQVRQAFASRAELDNGVITYLDEWSAIRFVKNGTSR